jgi:glyoxylase-like metal-dependent hydrolase (beta-lactamase superfamily II)
MKALVKFCCFLIALSFPWYAVAQLNAPAPVSLNKIADRLYEVKGGSGANGGAFIGEYGVLLIDAKMNKESVDQTIREIRKITDKPIRFLVNTHSDGDHVSGNRFFPESVVFVASENCRQEFFHPGRNGEPSSWNDPELAKYIPSVTFNSKMDLFVDQKKTELWYFGTGHTTGDIVVYFPDCKIAFVGDQVFKGRTQLIHSYKGGNSFKHVETLEKMLKTIDAEKFYSGHSEPFGRDMVRAHIDEMKELQGKVAGYMKKDYTLENIKKEFSNDQVNLVETIYREIEASR